MRKGSYRLGEAFGIGVYVHWSFLLLLAYVVFSTLSAGAGWAIAVNGVIFVCAVFACVTLHEFGHALAARRYGIETHDITLLPIGGVARLMELPRTPKQELVIALAGPAVNVVIAGVLSLVFVLLGKPQPGALAALSSDTAILYGLIYANIVLVVFNMIPAFPMDGGRVFRALVAMKKGMLPATEVAAKLGKFFAVLMFVGSFYWTPFLLLTAAFVWFAGQQELMAVRMRYAPPPIDPIEAMLRRSFGGFVMPDASVPPGEPRPVRGRVVEP
jgi:Zn-dependent protease